MKLKLFIWPVSKSFEVHLLGSFPFVTCANTHYTCYTVKPSRPNSGVGVVEVTDIVIVWYIA